MQDDCDDWQTLHKSCSEKKQEVVLKTGGCGIACYVSPSTQLLLFYFIIKLLNYWVMQSLAVLLCSDVSVLIVTLNLQIYPWCSWHILWCKLTRTLFPSLCSEFKLIQVLLRIRMTAIQCVEAEPRAEWMEFSGHSLWSCSSHSSRSEPSSASADPRPEPRSLSCSQPYSYICCGLHWAGNRCVCTDTHTQRCRG